MKTLITVLLALSAFVLQAFARTQTAASMPSLSGPAACVVHADGTHEAMDVHAWRIETLAASEEAKEPSCSAAAHPRRCTQRT